MLLPALCAQAQQGVNIGQRIQVTRDVVDSLNAAALKFGGSDNLFARQTAHRALKYALVIHYDLGTIYALHNLALINCNEGNYSTSLEELSQGLKIAQALKNPTAVARSYYYLGELHKNLGHFEKARLYYKQAYMLFTQVSDSEFANMSISSLAHTYMDEGDLSPDSTLYKNAIVLYHKSLHDAQKMGNQKRIASGFINLAHVYTSLGEANPSRYYASQSLLCALKAVKQTTKYNLFTKKIIALNNLGEALELFNRPRQAIVFYEQSFNLCDSLNELSMSLFVTNQLGKAYGRLGQYDKAIAYLEQSIARATHQKDKRYLQRSYDLLAGVYDKTRQYEQALHFTKLASAYKDTLANEQKSITIKGMKLDFESDSKDKEIMVLNHTKIIQEQSIRAGVMYRNMLITGCALLILLLVIVYVRYREKYRAEKRIIQAKEAAEKAKEAQEQFLTNTSHEIRTPMNGIIGMTNQLMESDLSREQEEYVSAINESANNLLVIINDLLDMSKIKAGKMTFQQKPFKIKDLFRNTTMMLEEKSRSKSLVFSALVDSTIPSTLIGDYVRLQQILLNLAGNAVKFTEKGEVKIVARAVNADERSVLVEFSVQDTGVGISPQNLSVIFESFTQVDAKINRKHGGTGLGLAITRQLVEQMGGHITVTSTEQVGSTFSFALRLDKKLPARKTSVMPRGSKATAPKQSRKFESLSVLVVDDNKINRQVAKLTLGKWNIQVHLAESAAGAITFLEAGNNPVDLVLMDVSMPGMDGFEATQYIRHKLPPPVCDMVIIAMTASALKDDRDKCLAVGMNDYISKPFKPENLHELIRKNIPQARMQQVSATNLDALMAKAEGDTTFLVDIMQTYVLEMPGYAQELNQLLAGADVQALRAQAHKMKSPVALFGALEIRDELQQLEQILMANGITTDAADKVAWITAQCLKSVEEVRAELERLLLQPV